VNLEPGTTAPGWWAHRWHRNPGDQMPASPSGAQSPKRDRRIVRKVIHVMRVIVVPLLITWQFPGSL
jgi:hypothetical protein